MARRNRAPVITNPSFIISRSLISKSITLLLRLLIIVLLIGFFGGIAKTFWDLRLIIDRPVIEALRQLILNVLILLAVIEVVRTVLGYLSDGRVRVTFIVDTVIIVMLMEVISSWFKGVNLETWIILMITILTLIMIRILAIRFSPDID